MTTVETSGKYAQPHYRPDVFLTEINKWLRISKLVLTDVTRKLMIGIKVPKVMTPKASPFLSLFGTAFDHSYIVETGVTFKDGLVQFTPK